MPLSGADELARLTSRGDSKEEPDEMSFQMARSCEARFRLVRAVRRRLSRAARPPLTRGKTSDEAGGVDAFAMGRSRVAATLPPVELGMLSLAAPRLALVGAGARATAGGRGNTGEDTGEASSAAFDGKKGEQRNLGSGRSLAEGPAPPRAAGGAEVEEPESRKD